MRSASAPARRNKPGRVTRTCLRCEATFETVQSQVDRGNGKYCSRSCWMASRKEPQPGRVCLTCQVFKDAAEFGVNPQHPPRLRSHCKECRRRKERERRQRDASRAQKQRLRTLLRAYGMTLEDYEEMLAAQGGACLICTRTQPGNGHLRLVVDHDHATGRVRGLLCNNCNVGLANFREDPSVLASAIRYLARR